MFSYLHSLLITVPAWNLDNPVYLTNLLLCILVPIALDVPAFFIFKRWAVRISLVVSETLFLFSYLFALTPLFYFSIVTMVVTLTYALIVNSSIASLAFSNNLKGRLAIKFRREKRKQGEALFDREEVYGRIRDAVLWMSKKKMGAIITFEKKNLLNEQMKTGTMINAPISVELLQTIFYPGTRLHDGAVIVRNDMIAAAAVFYTPTTRPLSGKYGSRHRAAIGISEISDAVTVVVSEETGRISIAHQGELISVLPDQFFDTFMDYMSMVSDDLDSAKH